MMLHYSNSMKQQNNGMNLQQHLKKKILKTIIMMQKQKALVFLQYQAKHQQTQHQTQIQEPETQQQVMEQAHQMTKHQNHGLG